MLTTWIQSYRHWFVMQTSPPFICTHINISFYSVSLQLQSWFQIFYVNDQVQTEMRLISCSVSLCFYDLTKKCQNFAQFMLELMTPLQFRWIWYEDAEQWHLIDMYSTHASSCNSLLHLHILNFLSATVYFARVV